METTSNQESEVVAGGRDSRQAGRWTREEHNRFVEALKLHGKNWKKVEEHVESRTGAQIRSHAQKFFNRLQKECGLSKSEVFGNPFMLDDDRLDMKMDGSITKKKNSSSTRGERKAKQEKQGNEHKNEGRTYQRKLKIKDIEANLETFSRKIETSIKSIQGVDETHKKQQIMSWSGLIKEIMKITEEFMKVLNKENPTNSKILYYDSFLKQLGGQIDLLNSISHNDNNLGKRPHSFSEDNIRTEYKKIPSLYDIVDIVKHSKNNGGEFDSAQTVARTRKHSFIINDENDDKIEKLKRLKEADYPEGRKRIMSLNMQASKVQAMLQNKEKLCGDLD